MASLLDPLPGDTLSFLRVIADGYAAADGCWPCWQWVRQQLWTRHDLDAEQILGGLPTWKHDYRPARLGYRGQPIPNIADEVPLSIHGMAYVYPGVPAVGQLVEAFLTALRSAAGLLGWAIDEQEIHGLLAQARELNEASANPASQPEGPGAQKKNVSEVASTSRSKAR